MKANGTALSLMGSTLTTSVLGVLFWAVAVHLYSAGQIGIDSALVSTMMTIATVCQLNLNNVIVRFLPLVRERVGRRVIQAYGTAALASLIGGVAFVLIAPAVSSRFHFLRGDAALAAVFVLGLMTWTIFTLQDAVLTALRRPAWLPVENGLFGAAKIAVLTAAVVILGHRGHGVFLAWVIPMWVTVPVVNALLARRVIPGAAKHTAAAAPRDVGSRRGVVAFIGQDLIGTVIAQMSMIAIPLIVVGVIGPRANAYFFIPFTLVTTFDLLFLSLATSITAEGARDETRISWLVKNGFRRFVSLQVSAVVMIILLAPLLLRPFGSAYAHHGATALRLLAGASCFRSILFIFSAIARVRRHGRVLLLVEAGTSLLLVALMVVVAPQWGIEGMAAIWLLVHFAFAVGVLPYIVRVVRGPNDAANALVGASKGIVG